jgi:CRISPR/Cas system-associated endonuclease Cas1
MTNHPSIITRGHTAGLLLLLLLLASSPRLLFCCWCHLHACRCCWNELTATPSPAAKPKSYLHDHCSFLGKAFAKKAARAIQISTMRNVAKTQTKINKTQTKINKTQQKQLSTAETHGCLRNRKLTSVEL